MDDQVWESTGTLVAVANVPWIGGGLKIAPDAVLDDGLLDVVVAGPFSKAGVVRIFPGIYGGKHVAHPSVDVFRSRSVLIEPLTDLGGPPPVGVRRRGAGRAAPVARHRRARGAVRAVLTRAPVPARPHVCLGWACGGPLSEVDPVR